MNERPVDPCRQAREWLAAPSPDALDPEKREELHRHLSRCAGCRTVASWMPAVESLVADQPEPPGPDAQRLAALRERVLEEVRGSSPAVRPVAIPWWRRWGAVSLFGPSAVLVLLLAVLSVREGTRSPGEPSLAPPPPGPAEVPLEQDARERTRAAQEKKAVETEASSRSVSTSAAAEDEPEELVTREVLRRADDDRSQQTPVESEFLDAEIAEETPPSDRFGKDEVARASAPAEAPPPLGAVRGGRSGEVRFRVDDVAVDESPPDLRTTFEGVRRHPDDREGLLLLLELLEDAAESRTEDPAASEGLARARAQALREAAPAPTLTDSVALWLRERLPEFEDATLRERVQSWLLTRDRE